MDLLTKSELKSLIEHRDGPAVSLYLPTHRAGPDTRKNPIRFKNLVTEAEEPLVAAGMRAPEARRLLEPAQNLVDDYDFWQRQSNGLAVFLSAEFFRTYRLPLDFEALMVVADRFHLKPLMPLLSDDGQFYVLALSQNEVRLLQATRFSVDEVELADVPESLAAALRFDEPEKQPQFHTATASSGTQAGRPAMFHGHGVGTEEEKNNILRYFQQIDTGLQTMLQDRQAPLILAGVDYLFPIYHQANSYPQLVADGVEGNPEELSAELLHQRAWKIAQPIFEQSRQEAVNQFWELTDTDRTSTDLRQIVPAAHYGRIETLFVALDRQQWGSFDPDTDTIELNSEARPDNEDLLDAAAVQTLSNGGTVYALEPEKVPDQVPAAAVFRYGQG